MKYENDISKTTKKLKTDFKLTGTETLGNAIKKAKDYYENHAKKAKDKVLEKVQETKKKYDAVRQPFIDSQAKYIQAKKTLNELKGQNTTQMSKTEKINLNKRIDLATKEHTTSLNNYKKAFSTMKNSKDIIQAYTVAQKAYKRISGKAQNLNNLSKRSKESVFHSLKRGLKLPNPGYYMKRGLTFRGEILKRSNTDNTSSNSTNQKKDKKWLVKKWSNETSAFPNKLKEYKSRGEAFMKTKTTRKVKLFLPDGTTPKIDPKTKKQMIGYNTTSTLSDIVKKGLIAEGKTMKNMDYKSFLVHINKLQEQGEISPRQYTVLQKYHKALRIDQMIKNSNTTRLTTDIGSEIKTLDEVQKRLGTYNSTETLLPEKLKIGFGSNKDAISDVKLLTVFSHEVNKKKLALNLEIDELNKLPDTDKSREDKIAALYKKYGLDVKANPPTSGIIEKISDNEIMDIVKKNKVFSYGDVSVKLTSLLTGVDDVEKLNTSLTDKKKVEAQEFFKDKISTTPRTQLNTIKTKLDDTTVSTPEAKKVKAAFIIETALKEERTILEDKLKDKTLDGNDIMQLKDLGLLELDGAGNVKYDKTEKVPILIQDNEKLLEHIQSQNKDIKQLLTDTKLTLANFKTPEDIIEMKTGLDITLNKKQVELQSTTTEEVAKLKALKDSPGYKKYQTELDGNIKTLATQYQNNATEKINTLTTTQTDLTTKLTEALDKTDLDAATKTNIETLIKTPTDDTAFKAIQKLEEEKTSREAEVITGINQLTAEEKLKYAALDAYKVKIANDVELATKQTELTNLSKLPTIDINSVTKIKNLDNEIKKITDEKLNLYTDLDTKLTDTTLDKVTKDHIEKLKTAPADTTALQAIKTLNDKFQQVADKSTLSDIEKPQFAAIEAYYNKIAKDKELEDKTKEQDTIPKKLRNEILEAETKVWSEELNKNQDLKTLANEHNIVKQKIPLLSQEISSLQEDNTKLTNLMKTITTL